MVADALAEVARAKQVVVVTHLPQIAARADRHLLVTKGVTRGIASTSVRVLGDEERVREVTRMLGDQGDPVLRRHATELLERRGRAVKGPA